MRGRRPKPEEVARKQGYPRKQKKTAEPVEEQPESEADSPIVPSESSQVSGPEAPEFLSPSGALVWETLAGQLEQAGLIKQTDLMTLARYCELFGIWLDLQKELIGKSKKGKVRTTHRVQDKDGRYVDRQRPQFTQLMSLSSELRQIEDRIGLNPAYRSHIQQRLAQIRAPKVAPSTSARPAAPPASPVGALARAAQTKH